MSQIYFICSDTLHVSGGLSVHHQEFKTVHTCLLAGIPANKQSAVSDICLLLYVQSCTPDDGRKTVRNM